MKKLPRDIRRTLKQDTATIRPQFKHDLKTVFLQGDTMANSLKSKRNFFSHKYLIPTGAALVLVALVGASTYNYGTNKAEKASLSSVQLPADLSTVKSIDEIRTLATIGLIADVHVTGVELKQEDGSLVYKVQFSDGTFKLFDAKTGDLMANPALKTESEVPVNFVAGVTIDAARTTAQAVFPDKTITKIELESENSVVVYSVRFSDGSRVDISAVDGTVVSSKEGATTSTKGKDTEEEHESEQAEQHESPKSVSGSNNSGSNNSGGSSSGSGFGGSTDSKSGKN
jgi:uncharacterized membrane protein YkoI